MKEPHNHPREGDGTEMPVVGVEAMGQIADGIRQMLRNGVDRQGIADRLGPLIDCIADQEDRLAAETGRRERTRKRT